MTSPGSSLFSGNVADGTLGVLLDAGLDTQGEVALPFAEPQRDPKPPADPAAANRLLAAALRDGDPNGDSLPRENGAPTRD
jgi:hypothetical protein